MSSMRKRGWPSDRSTMKSINKMPGDGAALQGSNPLIIVDDCESLSIQSSKSSHLSELTAKLRHGKKNYLVEILPGDWAMAWIVNYEDQAVELIKNLKGNKACNDWDSGLKFVGRVDSLRNQNSVDRPGGKVFSTYSLNCTGFKELDTEMFYDLALAESGAQDFTFWMPKLKLNDAFDFTASKNNASRLLTRFFEIMMGEGLDKSQVETVTSADGSTEIPNIQGPVTSQKPGDSAAPYAYLVPYEIGKTLGRTGRSKSSGLLAYADIFEFIYGVQKYEGANSKYVGQRFQPVYKEDEHNGGTYKNTGDDMLGSFLPAGITITNKPLWSLLNEFLNPVINELYATLRINSDGKILPTIIARQIPFTSNVFNNESLKIEGPTQDGSVLSQTIPVTRFLDLPRWVMHPALFAGEDIGRSNATRTNFVHVYGQSRLSDGVPMWAQITTNPPIVDTMDIQRSGLRSFMGSTACEISDQLGKVPTVWMQLIADRMVNSQLTINGTISMVGIQSPIAIGDNLQWNGVVYHIESVSHVCSIDMDGRKSFMTSLTLTNGLRDLDDKEASANVANNADDLTGNTAGSGTVDPSFTKSGDFPIYPGISTRDNITFKPGVTDMTRFDTEIKKGGSDDVDGDATATDSDAHIRVVDFMWGGWGD